MPTQMLGSRAGNNCVQKNQQGSVLHLKESLKLDSLQMLKPTISKKAKLNYLTPYLHFLKSYKIINRNFMGCR